MEVIKPQLFMTLLLPLFWLGPYYNAVMSIKNDTFKYEQATGLYNVNPYTQQFIFSLFIFNKKTISIEINVTFMKCI